MLGAMERDGYIDLLRGLALAAVVYGHWLVMVVAVGDGGLRTANLLTLVPEIQLVTWVFQVMPLFFVVGGYANATSWRAAQRRGEDAAAWSRARLRRLGLPAAALVGGWLAVAAALAATGFDRQQLEVVLWLAVAPLWFVPVYGAIVWLVPRTLALHEHYGWRVPALLAGLTALTDLAALAVPAVAWANLGWVWLAAHQLGYLWRDGVLASSSRAARRLALGGLGALALLVWPGPYPVIMVGIDTAGRSNSTPPTLALLALAHGQTGLALLCRRSGERWLTRPRLRAAVAFANRSGMTVYVWHLSVLALLGVALELPGLWPDTPTASAAWWALRPVWLAALTATTALVVWSIRAISGGDAPHTRA
jgi:hypothetical protein